MRYTVQFNSTNQRIDAKLDNRSTVFPVSYKGVTTIHGKDGFSPTVDVKQIEGGYLVTITDKNGPHTFDVMGMQETGLGVRLADVTLYASKWLGSKSPYYQVVSVPTVTSKTQVDLTPSAEQLAIFHNKDLGFVTENNKGVVTVYAIGQKPTSDYTIQATLTEVEV